MAPDEQRTASDEQVRNRKVSEHLPERPSMPTGRSNPCDSKALAPFLPITGRKAPVRRTGQAFWAGLGEGARRTPMGRTTTRLHAHWHCWCKAGMTSSVASCYTTADTMFAEHREDTSRSRE